MGRWDRVVGKALGGGCLEWISRGNRSYPSRFSRMAVSGTGNNMMPESQGESTEGMKSISV